MQTIVRQRLESRKRRLTRRLDKHNYPDDLSQPLMRGRNLHYELAGRAVGTAYGGMGLVRPSHEGAAALFDECIALCRQAGFQKILLRGDTDFTQTKELDRWHADKVQFVFGLDVTAGRHIEADDLPAAAWKPLERPPKYQVQTRPRAAAQARQAADRRRAPVQGHPADR